MNQFNLPTNTGFFDYLKGKYPRDNLVTKPLIFISHPELNSEFIKFSGSKSPFNNRIHANITSLGYFVEMPIALKNNITDEVLAFFQPSISLEGISDDDKSLINRWFSLLKENTPSQIFIISKESKIYEFNHMAGEYKEIESLPNFNNQLEIPVEKTLLKQENRLNKLQVFSWIVVGLGGIILILDAFNIYAITPNRMWFMLGLVLTFIVPNITELTIGNFNLKMLQKESRKQDEDK